jgi:D-beta-D-heptose 7-phosphate kinase/D-beta-D-heptose 1-phosphate adenosyltransferase
LGRAEVVPVRQQQVYDVTGAGDAVLSALGYGLSVGGDWPHAIRLANLAGAVEVQRLGVVPFDRRELLAEFSQEQSPSHRKILPLDHLQARLRGHRQRGQRIVMTNGCFDLLHPGHLTSLQFARGQGDCLVVGLNSDRTVSELKGPDRPLLEEQSRAEMLAALSCVDYVVIFDELEVAGLVKQILPDVLVKSCEYSAEQVVGHEIVREYGGRVLLAPMKDGFSTSRLIERLRAAPNKECKTD